jgi:hypothetical protein
MSEDAILWKLGFGAMVLAVSLLALLTRSPPETVLEPVVVTPRIVPAADDPLHRPVPVTASLGPKESLVDATEPAPKRPVTADTLPATSPASHPEALQPPPSIVAAAPQAPTPFATRAAVKRRATAPAAVVAVRAPRGAIVRTVARAKPAPVRSPSVSRRPHYPFDPRQRWADAQPP